MTPKNQAYFAENLQGNIQNNKKGLVSFMSAIGKF